MPNPMKIQPVDFTDPKPDQVVSKPVFRSRVRRLFDRQRRTPATQPFKPALTSEQNKDGSDQEFDPSSLCLANMVQNYIEESNSEKQRCGKNRCNCFNGTASGSSDDEWEFYSSSSISMESACDVLKSLAPCASVSERNILADVSKIVEKNKRKDGACKESVVVDGLIANGYNASLCKSKWDKSPSFPAGEYEYVDVITKGDERIIIEIDFRSEFEIARPTKAYKAILQTLPIIFVGKPDRLEKIIDIASEAAKKSLKKKGMSLPPWRRAEYVKAKWLSPQIKPNTNNTRGIIEVITIGKRQKGSVLKQITSSDGEIEIISNNSREKFDFFGVVKQKKKSSRDGEGFVMPFKVDEAVDEDSYVFVSADSTNSNSQCDEAAFDAKSETTMVKKCEPTEIVKPKSTHKGGLTSLIEDDNKQ